MTFWNQIKRFDAYPKTVEDVRVRTYTGAAVSILSAIFIILLFFSELSFYMEVDVVPELLVDTSKAEKLRINIDVIFPSLPCSYVSLDAMDISGEHQLDVAHNIFKKRLDASGKPLGVTKEEALGTALNMEKDGSTADLPTGYCGSCYGAETSKGQCCNTCEEVREAYRNRGWSFTNANQVEQCIREGFTEKLKAQQFEGCQIYGYLLVNKVAGNFHFAPGKSFQSQSMHVHDLEPLNFAEFNMSHQIVSLSFGEPYPGQLNPLDNTQKVLKAKKPSMFQYFIKIVPTIYENLNGKQINTNQFSVTEHSRVIEEGHGGGKGGHGSHGLPGVFFVYDLSPIMVHFHEKQKSLSHFLTGVCAIIGGVLTVAGIIDSFIYHSIRSLEKKIQLGKNL